MPSGKIHALATVAAAGIAGPVLVMSLGKSIGEAVPFAVGCLVGLIVTPDLDMLRRSYSHTLVRRSLGRAALRIWQIIWAPYAWLLPHRHPFSHWPVVGTLLRVFYLLAVLTIAWLPFQYGLGLTWPGHFTPSPAWLWALAGLVLADALHFVMDAL